MKRWIALATALLLSLTGCGKSGTVVGTWEQVVDVAGGLADTFVDEQAAYFLEIDEVPFYMTVTFAEDGTYSMELNVEKSRAGLKKFVDAWYTATTDLWGALLEQNESDAAVSDMLIDFEEYHGKSLREKLSEQIVLEDFAENFKASGTYRVEGDKLYRHEDASIYETIVVESDTLHIVSSSDPDLSKDDAAGYPYTFTRVK